jgi:hypothetical protein
MLLSHVLYIKFVDNKGKCYWSGVMLPESMCLAGGAISIGGEAFDE